MTRRFNLGGVSVTVASSFRQRLVGLLGRRSLAPNAGLLLVPCNHIHTAFMRFDIDAVFFNDIGIVLDIRPALGPFRVVVVAGAAACLELPSGGAARLGLWRGQRLAPMASVLRGRP